MAERKTWLAALCAAAIGAAVGACAQPEARYPPLASTGPSPGCTGPPPAKPPTGLRVAGRQREFILALPGGYSPRRAHDLVFAFHGRTNPSRKVRGYFDLERHARRPTIFVYPSGLPRGGGFSWYDPDDPAGALRDYRLFDALLAKLGNDYCVDLNRVFLVGHSLGAWFANSLGCARGNRVRAVATLAGGIVAAPCRGKVAALIAHNPNDRLVPFSQGEAVREHLLAGNGLAGRRPSRGAGPLNCRRYQDQRYPLLWCPHRQDHTWRGSYYPHNWPRQTGALMMTFFASLAG